MRLAAHVLPAYRPRTAHVPQEAYGEGAFAYVPRSYLLPGQYWVWRSWAAQSGLPPELPWVLKANEHRGRGVRVLPQLQVS